MSAFCIAASLTSQVGSAHASCKGQKDQKDQKGHNDHKATRRIAATQLPPLG